MLQNRDKNWKIKDKTYNLLIILEEIFKTIFERKRKLDL